MKPKNVHITLRRRSDLHLSRKAWHLIAVLILAIAYQILSRDQALITAAILGGFAVTLDLVRLQWAGINNVVLKFMGPLMRENERNGLAGTTWLAMGAFIIIWFYPKPVVTLSLLFLAVADPLASYVGLKYGKDKLLKSKSLQGTGAGFVACTLITIIYLSTSLTALSDRLLLTSLLAGLIGALSELLPIGQLDDNFTFPLVNATLLHILFSIVGGPAL